MAKPEFDPNKPFDVSAEKPAFDPSKPFQILDDVTEKAPEMIETGARSALEGITGGLSEPVISGINAVVGNMIEAGFDAESIGEFAKQAVSSEAIKKQYEKDIARRRGLEAEFPEVSIPSEIGGAVLGGFATGGLGAAGRLGAAGKALTAAPRAAEALAAGAAKAVPKIAGAIPQAAVRGAVAAGSAEALKAAAQVPTGVMAPEEMAIGEAALLGGKLGAGAETLVQGIKASPELAKKALSAFGGVRDEAIDTYLKDPGAFVRAKSPEKIKKAIDQLSDGLRESIESGKVDVDRGQQLLTEAKQALKDEAAKRRDEFKMARFDAKALMTEAQRKFDEAKQVLKADTKAALTADSLALRDETVDAVSALKEKVKQQSQKSYEILGASGRVVQVKPAISAAKAALKDLEVQGKAPTAGASAKSYAAIKAYVDDLQRYKNILSASDAKKKIQQLDQDWSKALDAGDMTDDAQRALRSIRRAFDEQLKNIPEYAEVMSALSRDTELLGNVNQKFGNLEKAGAKVARITLPDRDLDRQLISELSKATGRNLEERLLKVQQSTQGLTPTVLQAEISALPEAAEARMAQMAEARLRMPGADVPFMKNVEEASVEAMAVRKAQQELIARQERLSSIQQQLKELGPFAKPASNISAISEAVADKNPEFTNYLKSLTQLSGQDFAKEISDLRVAEAFNKEFRIGSRNVNLWAIAAGGAAYGLTGDAGTAAVVMGLGSGFGSMIDRFGPRMTQKVLDAYLKVEGLPTLQKIDRAFSGLPPEIISSIKNDLIRGVAVASSEPITVAPSQVEAVRADIMESDLPTTKKAKLVSEMSRGKPIPSGDLGAVMVGKKARGPLYVPEKKPQDLKMDRPDVLKALQGLKE